MSYIIFNQEKFMSNNTTPMLGKKYCIYVDMIFNISEPVLEESFPKWDLMLLR